MFYQPRGFWHIGRDHNIWYQSRLPHLGFKLQKELPEVERKLCEPFQEEKRATCRRVRNRNELDQR